MSLEWFDRVSGELEDHLESICDKYDQVGHMKIERAAKHPRIEFFVETADVETEELDRDYFCTLFFDPQNEEFYVDSYNVDSGLTAKIILSDIEEIIDEVHESFHDYMNDDEYLMDDVDDLREVGRNEEEDYYETEQSSSNNILEEIDVEWSTPEVTAFHHEDEVEVTYQFGVIQETGDGILKRVNRIWTTEDDLLRDESHFIFSKEEASTIIAMIASHMDQLTDFDFN